MGIAHIGVTIVFPYFYEKRPLLPAAQVSGDLPLGGNDAATGVAARILELSTTYTRTIAITLMCMGGALDWRRKPFVAPVATRNRNLSKGYDAKITNLCLYNKV